MIHVRIDNRHSTAVDIYVNIEPKTYPTSSSPIPFDDEHVYDRLFDTKTYPTRESKIVQNKKNYTLEQILNNVETIQKQYEQVIHNRTKSSPSCFFTFKQLTKILKNRRTIKSKTNHNQSLKNNYSDNKSPFIFGGETLQWIALPQDDQHIYENEFVNF